MLFLFQNIGTLSLFRKILLFVLKHHTQIIIEFTSSSVLKIIPSDVGRPYEVLKWNVDELYARLAWS